MTYLLQKRGVYYQGVALVGLSLREAVRLGYQAAGNDLDDYHSWEVSRYTPMALEQLARVRMGNPIEHEILVSFRKGRDPEFHSDEAGLVTLVADEIRQLGGE